MIKCFFTTSLTAALTFAPLITNSTQMAEPRYAELKKTVVNVQTKFTKFLGMDRGGTFNGTGFVVDKERGLIVTNRHVAPPYSMNLEVTFLKGESAPALLKHYDPLHDFAILQVKPQDIPADTRAAVLGSVSSVKTGDSVLLIGNNEAEEHTLKMGVVSNLDKNKGDRHSLTVQTSFDRTGGSSGSPVWNEKNEVIGLHYKGTDTSSFELAIDYVRVAVEALQKGQIPARGDIGVKIDFLSKDKSTRFYKLPKAALARLPSEEKLILFAEQIVPNSPAHGKLQPGDVLWALDGKLLGQKMYEFDLWIDQNVGGNVNIDVYREGKLLSFSLPVHDALLENPQRFITYAGGTFHDLTTDLRLSYDIADGGVYLSQADHGSTFAELGVYSEKVKDRKCVVVLALNGQRIKNLHDWIEVVSKLKESDAVTAIYKDHLDGGTEKTKPLVVNLKSSLNQVFSWDKAELKWNAKKL